MHHNAARSIVQHELQEKNDGQGGWKNSLFICLYLGLLLCNFSPINDSLDYAELVNSKSKMIARISPKEHYNETY